MSNKKKYILEGTNLTGLTAWLNINKKKITGSNFTVSDTQQYIHQVGRIPEYLGGNEIEINKKTEFTRETYNLLEK